jgi:hypothetical protein
MAQSARTPAFDAVYDTDQGNNTTIARRVADKVARMEAITERARFKKVRTHGGVASAGADGVCYWMVNCVLGSPYLRTRYGLPWSA